MPPTHTDDGLRAALSHEPFGLAADTTREVLLGTARSKACPGPRTVVYPGLPAAYTATCVGDEDFNGFYGEGIIDAQAAVAKKKP